MILPHLIDVKRLVPTFNATTGAEIAPTLTTIYTDVPALVSPAGTGVIDTGMGQIERQDDLIFLDALDEHDQPYVIRNNDQLVRQDNEDVWLADVPGAEFEMPTRFASGEKTKHHIEVRVTRADLESAGIR